MAAILWTKLCCALWSRTKCQCACFLWPPVPPRVSQGSVRRPPKARVDIKASLSSRKALARARKDLRESQHRKPSSNSEGKPPRPRASPSVSISILTGVRVLSVSVLISVLAVSKAATGLRTATDKQGRRSMVLPEPAPSMFRRPPAIRPRPPVLRRLC